MAYYKKITIWENRKRTELLVAFRNLVDTYFTNLEDYSHLGLDPHENEKAKKARREINMILDKMHSVIILAGVSPTIYYSPPPAIGGLAGTIDLIYNIFNLHHFEIKPENLLDLIDRAVGIYENDRLNAWLRTINPLFWLGLILDYIVSLPFKIIGKIGFNQERVESSIMGRITKGVLYLIIVLAAFLEILEKIGYLEKLKSLIQRPEIP